MTPKNAGSYDYQSPGGIMDYTFNDSGQIKEHLFVDVLPWLKYGNSPQDTTTRLQREKTMASSYKGAKGLEMLGYTDQQIKDIQNAK